MTLPGRPTSSVVRGDLLGARALVAGASRGIGRATALGMAAAGAHVTIAARDQTALTSLAEQIRASGANCDVLTIDLSTPETARKCIAKHIGKHGGFEVGVYAAGTNHAASFAEHQLGDFERVMRVNLLGAVAFMQAVLPHMATRGFGRLILFSSVAGRWGTLNQSAYGASKHALIGLMRCVAAETAARGVTVNAICPGMVDTAMLSEHFRAQAPIRGMDERALAAAALGRVPIGRLLDPEEIASLAVFLASRGAGGITGQSIMHDGGMLYV